MFAAPAELLPPCHAHSLEPLGVGMWIRSRCGRNAAAAAASKNKKGNAISIIRFFTKSSVVLIVFLIFFFIWTEPLRAQNESTLFDAQGRATAYIDDDMTIYLWSGKPVAFIYPDTSHEVSDIYGFNGKHLGWFIKGIARGNDGSAECGVKSVVSPPQVGPLKSPKEYKPPKALLERRPLTPNFSQSWSDTPCRVFLFEGYEG